GRRRPVPEGRGRQTAQVRRRDGGSGHAAGVGRAEEEPEAGVRVLRPGRAVGRHGGAVDAGRAGLPARAGGRRCAVPLSLGVVAAGGRGGGRGGEPVFRHALEDVDALFHELSGGSLLEELGKPEGESRLDETAVVQPAVMAIQIGLLKLYEHYGIRPRAVMGHSIGEVAAAFAAGALTLEDAVQVIWHRSQAQSRVEGKGGMLAVGRAPDPARKLLEGLHGRVSIGAINGPEMLTLSGDVEPLQRLAQILDARGVFNRPVRVRVAYHSHHLDPVKEVMLQGLGQVPCAVATTPLYSSVTGRRELGTHLSAEYWYDNARQPVLFAAALAAMLKDGYDTFVEIGPHPVLVAGSEALFVKREADAVIGPSMTRREPEVVVFLHSLARLAARGLHPDVTV